MEDHELSMRAHGSLTVVIGETVLAVQPMVSDAHVGAFERRGQWHIADEATEAFDMVIQAQGFDDHGRTLS